MYLSQTIKKMMKFVTRPIKLPNVYIYESGCYDIADISIQVPSAFKAN